jgi:5-methylcytosine-specific restriction protein A
MKVCSVHGCPNLTKGSRCARHRYRNGSTRAWREVRAFVLRRDGYVCWQCGAPATDADHIVPKVEGGSDQASNLRASCAKCNRSRGAKAA